MDGSVSRQWARRALFLRAAEQLREQYPDVPREKRRKMALKIAKARYRMRSDGAL